MSKQGKLRIAVQDEGAGIPKGELDHLFHRFIRTSNAQSLYPNGVGMSLYIAKAILEAHNGTITLVNAPKHGAICTIDLPEGAAPPKNIDGS